MTQFPAIIFDMDGLLVDTEPLWFLVERDILTARGAVYDHTVHQKYIGLRLDEFWGNIVRDLSLSDEPASLVREVTAGMVARVALEAQPRPGAEALIAYLRDIGKPCAIASSSPTALIDAVVRARGWDDFFTLRVSGDEVARGKPAPDVYLETARRMGVPPEHCLALEDSKNGARAAVAAGMTCFAVPDLSHVAPGELEQITPHVFNSLNEVLALLQQDETR